MGRWGPKVMLVAVAVLAGGFSPPATAASLPLPPPAPGAWADSAAPLAHTNDLPLFALPDGGALSLGMERTGQGIGNFTVQRWSAQTGVWTLAANPSVPRESAGATQLSDGRVLLIGGGKPDYGGVYDYDYLASTEIFDPATGSWSPGPTLTQARRSAEATVLPDGTVMVAGGWVAQTPRTVEVLDIAAGTSRVIASPDGNADPGTLRVIGNGRFVLGLSGSYSPIYGHLYDIAAGTWTPVPGPATYARRSSVVLPDGRFLTLNIGSSTARERRVQLFDPDSRAWSYGPPTLSRRDGGDLALLGDGRVLAVSATAGGMSAETLDVSNMAAGWSPVAAPTGVAPSYTSQTGLVALHGGGALLVGFDPRSGAVFDPSAPAAPYAYALRSTPPSLKSTITRTVDFHLALSESTTAATLENVALLGGVKSGPNQGAGNCYGWWYGSVTPCVTDQTGAIRFMLRGNGGAGVDIVEFTADFDRDGLADEGEPTASVVVEWSRIETVLNATPHVAADQDGNFTTFDATAGQVRARLTHVDPASSARTEYPLAGRVVRFMAGTRTLCSAVTNWNGWATCSAPPGQADVVVADGYVALYDGERDYANSYAKGRLAKT